MLLAAARERRLVVFAGAGISMAAPTSLPSWRDVNRIVVRSLASEAAQGVGAALAEQGAELILGRHEQNKLPPEYQSQVLAELLRGRYFELLRHIDSDRPNANHLALAWLAKLGCVRAIVTTNFDRLIESAFAAADESLQTHYRPEHFHALADDLARFDRAGEPCQLLKLHGSVDDPATLIDTLAQRKRGLAVPVLDSVRHLLHHGHWLFLGFSGLDLEAEPNYLALSQEASTGCGFSWLVREHAVPTQAVAKLKELYGDRAEIASGDLPEWLLGLVRACSSEPGAWIERHAVAPASGAALPASAGLEQRAAEWAQGLQPSICSIALAFVVAACAEPRAAAMLVETVLQKLDEPREAGAQTSLGSLYTKALAANALCVMLGGLGRHEDAVKWGSMAIELARQGGDPDTEDRIRGNVAVSLETLGRIADAREMYESALAGARGRGDPAALAAALNGLAAHLIRQARLDDATRLADEAMIASRHAGDERLRGVSVSLLGQIAKLKGEYPSALERFTECERLFARLGNDEAVAAAAGNRGEVLSAMGRFDEAERVYDDVLKALARIERLDNVAATYLSLGTLNRDRRDHAAAEAWFGKAVESYRRLGDPANEAFALGRLAETFSATDRYDEALKAAEAALPLVSDRNPAFAANLLNQMGLSGLRLGKLDVAEQAYRSLVPIAEAIGNSNSLAAARMNLGTIMLLHQKDAEAAAFFSQAAELWQALGRPSEYEHCKLGEAAVTLDQKIGALSDEGHRRTDPQAQRGAAREMVALYPELISMYERLGATALVAAFCASAASTARFAGEISEAVDWYEKAGQTFLTLRDERRAREMLVRCEELLKKWIDALLRAEQGMQALPLLLRLAEVSGRLGNRGVSGTSILNAAIILLSSQRFENARELASQALELLPADAEESATARRLIAHCEAQVSAAP